MCHERPILSQVFDERLEFIEADLPVPKKDHDAMIEGDKVGKLLIAMRRVRELNADYVMPVDADDLVSNRIVEHVLTNPEDGWYVERGWQYEYGRSWIERVDNFNLRCGTCNVLARRWFVFPGDPARERSADVALIVKGHGQVVEAFASQGAVMRPFPFSAAVYTVCNGENTSELQPHEQSRSNQLRRLAGRAKRAIVGNRAWLRRRPCVAATRREFALVTTTL